MQRNERTLSNSALISRNWIRYLIQHSCKERFCCSTHPRSSCKRPKDRCRTSLRQGIEQFDRGQYEAASKLYQQALTIYRNLKDKRGEGQVLTELGMAYAALGDIDRAIASYEQSLAIARELGDRSLEAIT